jgi:hypothetical protein
MPNANAWFYVKPAFGGTAHSHHIGGELLRPTVCKVEPTGELRLNFDPKDHSPFVALLQLEIACKQPGSAALVAKLAAAAVQHGATCVLIGWPDRGVTIDSIGCTLSEKADNFDTGFIDLAADAIGCVPVAIIRAVSVDKLTNALQKSFQLKPSWLSVPLEERHYERGSKKETTGSGSGLASPPPPLPLQRSAWGMVSAGFSYSYDAVIGKPTLSSQLKQRLNSVRAEPFNTEKRLDTISLLSRLDDHCVDVDAVRELIGVRLIEQPAEFAWLAIVAYVLRDKLMARSDCTCGIFPQEFSLLERPTGNILFPRSSGSGRSSHLSRLQIILCFKC